LKTLTPSPSPKRGEGNKIRFFLLPLSQKGRGEQDQIFLTPPLPQWERGLGGEGAGGEGN